MIFDAETTVEWALSSRNSRLLLALPGHVIVKQADPVLSKGYLIRVKEFQDTMCDCAATGTKKALPSGMEVTDPKHWPSASNEGCNKRYVIL